MKKKLFIPKHSQIRRNVLDEGTSIEENIRAAIAGNEPIEARDEMIYTPKADGVKPEYDIRTDRQELALDATDKFSKSMRASTDENPKDKGEETKVETPKE